MPTFPPLHEDLTFLSPLSQGRAERLFDFLTAHEPATALDLGCGWAELLLRVLEAVPSASGLGSTSTRNQLAPRTAHRREAGVGWARDLRSARRP